MQLQQSKSDSNLP